MLRISFLQEYLTYLRATWKIAGLTLVQRRKENKGSQSQRLFITNFLTIFQSCVIYEMLAALQKSPLCYTSQKDKINLSIIIRFQVGNNKEKD
jgi:hypothetical protein